MAIQYISAGRYAAPEILDEADYAELTVFLSAEIPSNLFQLSWLENYGIDSPREASAFIFVGVRAVSGQLAAAALLVGRSLALVYGPQPGAPEALGRWCRRHQIQLDHIVSARPSVDAFWQAYAAGDPENHPPTLEAHAQRAQSLYVLERACWAARSPSPSGYTGAPIRPRRARLDEIEAVFLASARMHREETGIDPLANDPDAFRRHVAHRISTGRCFVHFDAHHRLLFKAELSAYSNFGAQISGVYTDPICRRKGIATAALFDICNQLFEGGSRRITLYVNNENEAAHRVYRRVGFKFHAPYQTIFV